MRGTTIGWVDGPGFVDVRVELAAAGYPFAVLDRAGVRLRRRLSRQVLAVTVLAAINLVEQGEHTVLAQGVSERRDARIERWCLDELGELARHPIPEWGPPPLHPAAICSASVYELWSRAAGLVETLGVHRPVAADRPAALRLVVRRMTVLASIVGPDRLADRAVGVRPAPPLSSPDRPGTGMLCLDVPIARWPETSFVAVIPTGGPAQAVARTPQLRWTDGPSPSQLELAFVGGLADPLARCRTYTVHRSLSDTAVAAGMLLYRRLHAEPYREPSAGSVTAAWMRSAGAHADTARHAACRERLDEILQVLLSLPLPLDGALPTSLEPAGAGDGARLWAAAGNLLALTYRRRPEHDPAHAAAAVPPRRGLAVELGSTLERLGRDALDQLAPDAAEASSNAGPA